jgi:hypothetical protein
MTTFFAICTLKKTPVVGAGCFYIANEDLGIYRSLAAAEARLRMLHEDKLNPDDDLSEMRIMPVKIHVIGKAPAFGPN